MYAAFSHHVTAYSPELDQDVNGLAVVFRTYRKTGDGWIVRVSPYAEALKGASVNFKGSPSGGLGHSCTCGAGSCYHFKAAREAFEIEDRRS